MAGGEFASANSNAEYKPCYNGLRVVSRGYRQHSVARLATLKHPSNARFVPATNEQGRTHGPTCYYFFDQRPV
jgi:hypothetical protein